MRHSRSLITATNSRGANSGPPSGKPAPACGFTSFYPTIDGMIAQSGDANVTGYVTGSMLEFSEVALQDAVKAYTGVEDFLHRVRGRVGAVMPGEFTPRFAAALDDDLSVPIALAEVHGARAEGNRALYAGDHDAAMAHARSIRAMMGILGADPLDERWESRDETSAALAAVDVLVQWALASRADARARRDWAAADQIRDRLKEAAIEVTDTADGPQWALLDGNGK